MTRKLIAATLALAIAAPLTAGPSSSGGSRPSGGGFSGESSRPSSSGGSSGRPSGSSGGSKPAAPTKGSGFSGGSKPSESKPSSGFSGGSAPAEKPKVKTATPLPDKTPTQVSRKPAAGNFNKLAVEDSKRAESRRNYDKAAAPAPTYKTPRGESRPIPPRDPEADYLRGRLDGERWASRPARVDTFYAGYAGRPVVLYADPYHPMVNYWLMSQSLDVATLWMFHHRQVMDEARYQAMLAQNAELRARVNSMENLARAGHATPRDPTWVPPGVDPDVMYDDGFVTASYNPTPKTVDEYEYDDDDDGPDVGAVLLWVFVWIPLTVGGVALVVWLVFVHRWK